jgi:hypothetical protein
MRYACKGSLVTANLRGGLRKGRDPHGPVRDDLHPQPMARLVRIDFVRAAFHVDRPKRPVS